jgi:hypothetical protein
MLVVALRFVPMFYRHVVGCRTRPYEPPEVAGPLQTGLIDHQLL